MQAVTSVLPWWIRVSGALSTGAPGTLLRLVLLLHLALSPLVFWTRLMEEFEFAKVLFLLLMATVAATLALTGWIARLGTLPKGDWPAEMRRRLTETVRDPVTLGVLLCAGSALLSTLTSISPRLSWFGEHDSFGGLVTILGYVLLFFATRAACPGPAHARWLLGAILAPAAVAAGYGLVQALHQDPFPWMRWNAQARPTGTMGNANFLAAYLAMALPGLAYFGYRAMQQRRWLIVAFLALCGLLCCLVLFLTLSRAGWLALGCAGFVLLVAWQRLRRPSFRTWTLAAGALVALILSLVLLARVQPTLRGAFQGVLQRLSRFTESPARMEIWSGGLRIFAEHPLLGSGPDTFRMAFAQHQSVDYWNHEWGGQPTRAHNEIIQILATQGVAGLATSLFLCAALVVAGVRAWRRAEDRDRPLVAAILAGLVAFGVQNLFCFTVAGCGTLFVTLAALLARLGAPCPRIEARAKAASDPSAAWSALGLSAAGLVAALLFVRNCRAVAIPLTPRLIVGCLGIATLFALVAWCLWILQRRRGGENVPAPSSLKTRAPTLRFIWPRLALQASLWGLAGLIVVRGLGPTLDASAACRLGCEKLTWDPHQACADLERAVHLNPWNDVYWLQLGIADLTRAREADSTGEKSRFLSRGRHALDQASTLEPERGAYRVWLARVLAEQSRLGQARPKQALDQLDQAISLERNNAYFYADACTSALSLFELDCAERYAQAGARLYPGFAPLRAQLGHIALFREQYGQAAEHLRRALDLEWRDRGGEAPAARAALAHALMKLARYEEAGEVARAVVVEAPELAAGHLRLAQALEKLGRAEEAAAAQKRFLELSGQR